MRNEAPSRPSRVVFSCALDAGCFFAPFAHRSRLRECIISAKAGAEVKDKLRIFLAMRVLAGALLLGCSVLLLLLARHRDSPQRTLADQVFVLCLCTSVPGQALGPIGTGAMLYANLFSVRSGDAEAFFRVVRPSLAFLEALLAYACYALIAAVLLVYFVLQTDPAQLAAPWPPLDSLWLSVVFGIPWLLALIAFLYLANAVAVSGHGAPLHDSAFPDTLSPTTNSEYSLGPVPSSKGGNGNAYAAHTAQHVAVNGSPNFPQEVARPQAPPHFQAVDLSRETRDHPGQTSPALSSVSHLTDFRDHYDHEAPIPGGFCRQQRVRTPKALKVGGQVAVMEGGQGYVVGPSSSASYVKVRFDSRVDGKTSSIDVLPDQVEPALWLYCPFNGLACAVRSEPVMDGQRTNFELRPGEVFNVSESVFGEDGILFLKIADGRGWVFDKTLDGGAMCVPHQDDSSHSHHGEDLLRFEVSPAVPPRAPAPAVATWRRETPPATPQRSAARL